MLLPQPSHFVDALSVSMPQHSLLVVDQSAAGWGLGVCVRAMVACMRLLVQHSRCDRPARKARRELPVLCRQYGGVGARFAQQGMVASCFQKTGYSDCSGHCSRPGVGALLPCHPDSPCTHLLQAICALFAHARCTVSYSAQRQLALPTCRLTTMRPPFRAPAPHHPFPHRL